MLNQHLAGRQAPWAAKSALRRGTSATYCRLLSDAAGLPGRPASARAGIYLPAFVASALVLE